MKMFLKNWCITALGVLVASQIVPGIHFTALGLVLATFLLGILNAVVRPILIVLSLPIMLLSLGFFLLIINALLLYWVGHLKDFKVDTFWDAFWGALIISVVSLFVNAIWKTEKSAPASPQRPPPPPPSRDDGQGPVIDV